MVCLRHCEPRLLRHLARPRRILRPRSASCAAHRRQMNGCAIRSHGPYWMDRRATRRCAMLIGSGGADPYQMKLCCLACCFYLRSDVRKDDPLAHPSLNIRFHRNACTIRMQVFWRPEKAVDDITAELYYICRNELAG